jgi:hypothetical protein
VVTHGGAFYSVVADEFLAQGCSAHANVSYDRPG